VAERRKAEDELWALGFGRCPESRFCSPQNNRWPLDHDERDINWTSEHDLVGREFSADPSPPDGLERGGEGSHSQKAVGQFFVDVSGLGVFFSV
jgi:hypothetical protein